MRFPWRLNIFSRSSSSPTFRSLSTHSKIFYSTFTMRSFSYFISHSLQSLLRNIYALTFLLVGLLEKVTFFFYSWKPVGLQAIGSSFLFFDEAGSWASIINFWASESYFSRLTGFFAERCFVELRAEPLAEPISPLWPYITVSSAIKLIISSDCRW